MGRKPIVIIFVCILLGLLIFLALWIFIIIMPVVDFATRFGGTELTYGGSIDRKALPEPTGHIVTGVEYTAPENETEKNLAGIWSAVLGIDRDKIGVDDSFFDLGGNSLLILQMRTLLDVEYPEKVTVANLFTYPTIKELSNFIHKGLQKTCDVIRPDFTAFPQEYFIDGDTVDDDDDDDDDVVYNFKIHESIQKKLKMFSELYGVNTNDILLALYVYLIYEVTGIQEITIHTMMDEKNTVNPFSISLTNIDDIEDFISVVGSVRQEKRPVIYPIENIYGFSDAKERISVSIIFYLENLLSENIKISKIYDIAMGVIKRENIMETVFEYNSECLENETMKKFIHGYMNLIELFANRYNNLEEEE